MGESCPAPSIQTGEFGFTFDVSVISESERIMEGVASLPTVDRENEIVLREALEKAIPYFMALPVQHLMHSERPVGLIEKMWFDDEGRLHNRYRIKNTPDADDVWDRVLNGELCKQSIAGRRLEGTASCKLRPWERTEPCITKALWLDSVTLCGTNAMNQGTWAEVVKAASEGLPILGPVAEFPAGNEAPAGTAVAETSAMLKNRVDGHESDGGKVTDDNSTEPQTFTKAEVEEHVSAAITKAIGSLVKAEDVQALVKAAIDDFAKASVEKLAPRIEAVEGAVEEMRKAGYVVKADVVAEVADLKKAFPELTERVTTMEKQVIEKSGPVVQIGDKPGKVPDYDIPRSAGDTVLLAKQGRL